MIRSLASSLALALSLLLTAATAALGVAGGLDPTFDGDGIALSPPGAVSATSIAIQADGKIVVAGCLQCEFRPRFAVYRYDADGSRDLAFGGGDGIVSVGFQGDARPIDVAVQDDGKIVAAGVATGGSNRPSFALARFEDDGTLDPTFGDGDGKVRTRIGPEARAFAVAVAPDGSIVAGGLSGTNDGVTRPTLVRYEPSGGLDPTFGGDGIVRRAIPGMPELAKFNDVLALPSGKVVGFGSGFTATGERFLTVRYHVDGSLDESFAANGVVTTSLGADSIGTDIARSPDGTLVGAGYVQPDGAPQRFAVVRYTSDGSLDTTFSDDGKVTTSVGPEEALGASVAVQQDLKIVVAGTCCSSLRVALARYRSDGSLDDTFDGGRVTLKIGDFVGSGVADVELDADGDIVVQGNYARGGERFFLARYLGA